MQTKSTFYLIGGAPRTGKTTLAKKLSQHLNIPWISTDTLESVVSQYVPEEVFNTTFPKTVIRRETGGSNDVMYEKYSSREIVDFYSGQAKALEKAVKVLIECEVKYNHSYIIEGYHITPELVESINNDEISVKAVFLGKEDLVNTLKSIRSSVNVGDWVIERTKDEETFEKIANMVVLFSTDLGESAEKHNMPYYLTDENFEDEIEEIFNYLIQQSF